MKKLFILLFLFLILFCQGCRYFSSADLAKKIFEEQEYKGILTTNGVFIVGYVEQFSSFPSARYMISTQSGKIWVVAKKNTSLPKENQRLIVIGTAKRFIGFGDFCIYESHSFIFSSFILIIVAIILLLVFLIYLLKYLRILKFK